jgi:hypothetical protein
MASPTFHATPAAEIARMKQELDDTERGIHAAYARWMELETLVEGERP